MSQNLKLEVLLSAINKATGPLKQITQGSNQTAKALKAARDRLRELNDQQKNIDGFRKLDAQLIAARHEESNGEVGDDRKGKDRDHRVDSREADVEGHIPSEQVTVEVGCCAARACGKQQHSDREHGRQLEGEHKPETDCRQKNELTGESDDHRLRVLRHAREIVRREAQPEPKHDDAQGNGQSDGGQR